MENIKEDGTINKERKVPCSECASKTYHKVLKSINYLESGDWGITWGNYEIIICQGCRYISFRKVLGTDDVIGQDEEGNFIYEEEEELFPPRLSGRKELEDNRFLPLDVGRVYRETYRAINGEQPILAGMGIRALVEAVCVEEKIKGRNLEKRIDNLVEADLLTKKGAEILQQIRLYGNDAAHEAKAAKIEDLGVLMDIAENLLHNTYLLKIGVAKLEKVKSKPKEAKK
ncbi:MAG: DUF4145 domain-containing protein [Patescibacteria group bacterium]